MSGAPQLRRLLSPLVLDVDGVEVTISRAEDGSLHLGVPVGQVVHLVEYSALATPSPHPRVTLGRSPSICRFRLSCDVCSKGDATNCERCDTRGESPCKGSSCDESCFRWMCDACWRQRYGAGAPAGVDAGMPAGMGAGTPAGMGAGTPAGADADKSAGEDAGADAGKGAGV